MTLSQYKNLIDYSSMNPKQRLDFCRGECHNSSETSLEKSYEIQKEDAQKVTLSVHAMQVETL